MQILGLISKKITQHNEFTKIKNAKFDKEINKLIEKKRAFNKWATGKSERLQAKELKAQELAK